MPSIADSDDDIDHEEIVRSREKSVYKPLDNRKRFWEIEFHEGVTYFNFFSFQVVILLTTVALEVKQNFVMFILQDPDYYNVPKDEVALEMGQINSICQVVTILAACFLGVVVDITGRKWIVIAGIFMMAIGLGLIPCFHTVYPAYLILRITVALGIIYAGGVPLEPDYVKPAYMGISYAYSLIFSFLGEFFSQTVVFKAATVVSDATIFFILGGCFAVGGVFMFWGIKDVFKEQIRQEKIERRKQKKLKQLQAAEELALNKSKHTTEGEETLLASAVSDVPLRTASVESAKNVLVVGWRELTREMIYWVAFIGLFVNNISASAWATFGSLYVQDSMEASGKTEDDSKNHLGNLYFCTTVIYMPMGIIVLYLMDRMKLWKLLIFFQVLMMLAHALELYQVYFVPFEDQINWRFDVGYVLGQICFGTVAGIPGTMVAKIVNVETRGFIFYLIRISCSLGILFIQYFGGYLYDTKGDKASIFLVSCIGQVIFFFITILAIARNKLI